MCLTNNISVSVHQHNGMKSCVDLQLLLHSTLPNSHINVRLEVDHKQKLANVTGYNYTFVTIRVIPYTIKCLQGEKFLRFEQKIAIHGKTFTVTVLQIYIVDQQSHNLQEKIRGRVKTTKTAKVSPADVFPYTVIHLKS